VAGSGAAAFPVWGLAWRQVVVVINVFDLQAGARQFGDAVRNAPVKLARIRERTYGLVKGHVLTRFLEDVFTRWLELHFKQCEHLVLLDRRAPAVFGEAAVWLKDLL
jgi:hypothetical protein